MVYASTLTAAAAALLCALPVQAGLYSKSSPVIQVDGKNYDRLIAQSNHTSIVKFYAPWCGHCKNLQPAYEKAAKSLAGLAKVTAVDCDEESNKLFCGNFGVQGFPTLKIVKPGKKPGYPIVEDYQGPRTAKGIVEAVTSKIPNNVKKVTDKDLESFLANANNSAKAILFTEKGTTSALLKALAVDFKGSISVAQIRNTEKASIELFGITTFPTLLLLPGGPEAEGIVYDGEMKKDAMVAFLSQAAPPNPDPAPAKVKMPKKKDDKKTDKKAEKAKTSFESASSSHASSEGSSAAASATVEASEEASQPTESPDPEIPAETPIILPEPAPPIPTLATEEYLNKECLGERSGTCILAFVTATHDELAATALTSLAEIAHKHHIHQRKLFPFYALPDDNTGAAPLKKSLGLSGDTVVIALNGRRGWWRHLEGTDMSIEAIENWVDAIRLGEGTKQKLPEGIVIAKLAAEEPAAAEEPLVETTEAAEPAAEETVADVHDEL